MDKDTAVAIMLNSFNDDTKAMCQNAGMSEEEADQKINENQMSLYFLLSNAYDKLEEAKGL
jgi:hypothetical protein